MAWRNGVNALSQFLVGALPALFVLSLPNPGVTQPVQGGTLIMTMAAEPPLLVSATNSSLFAGVVSTKIHDGLLVYDEKLQPQPGLAEKWAVSPDGLTIRLDLRGDVKWHDGQPFTAEDVKFSLEEVWRKFHPRGQTTFAKVTA